MPKDSNSNRLPAVSATRTPTSETAGKRLGTKPVSLGNNSAVRSLLSHRLEEKNRQRNDEAFLLPLSSLVPNPNQPRQVHDAERDAELAQDISVRGILEPIIVRPINDGKYEIVAGERRYRAALVCELEKIPVIIKDYDNEQAQAASLVENLQRQDLHPSDEARYFQLLMDQYNFSLRDIADFVHRSVFYVRSRLDILKEIPNDVITPADVSDLTNIDSRLEETPSEINHKRDEKSQKLQISQTGAVKPFAPIKTVAKFGNFLNQATLRVTELDTEKKIELIGQLRSLREQLQILEASMMLEDTQGDHSPAKAEELHGGRE